MAFLFGEILLVDDCCTRRRLQSFSYDLRACFVLAGQQQVGFAPSHRETLGVKKRCTEPRA